MDRGIDGSVAELSWEDQLDCREPEPPHVDGPLPPDPGLTDWLAWCDELHHEWTERRAAPPVGDEPGGGTTRTLESVEALLETLPPEADRDRSAAEQLELLLRWRRLGALVEARTARQVAQVDGGHAAMAVHGLSTRTWLAQTERITAREAGRVLARASELTRFDQVTGALSAGRIGVEQAAAITDTLSHLPAEFDHDQLRAAETAMLGYAGEFDTAGLRRLGHHIVEVVAPEIVEQSLADRLERERRAARAGRGLSFTRDGHGSIHLRGRLPLIEGEELVAIVDAHVRADRSRYAATDPLAEVPSGSALRADALMRIVRGHQESRSAPSHGGDRPRIVVTIDHEDLLDRSGIGTLASGEQVAPSELRRIACEAGLLPVVLGGRGQVLDLGTEQRLATSALRAALSVRDQGCVMPGCDRPPPDCEAHHVIPWQSGGPTELGNLVLLCRHHHGIVEPRPGAAAGRQWEVTVDDHGLPWVRPPVHVDAGRTPLRHHRFDRAGPPARADAADPTDRPP